MGVEQTRKVFAEAFADKRRKKWRLNHSPMFLDFLQRTCGIKSVKRVVMHEALTNIRPVIFLQFKDPDDGDVWRALKAASAFKVGVGKMIVRP